MTRSSINKYSIFFWWILSPAAQLIHFGHWPLYIYLKYLHSFFIYVAYMFWKEALSHFVLSFLFSVMCKYYFCLQATQFNRSALACLSSSSNRRNPASASVPAGTLLKTRVQRVPPPLFQSQHSHKHQSPLLPYYRSPQSLHIIQPPPLPHAASLSLPRRWVRRDWGPTLLLRLRLSPQ